MANKIRNNTIRYIAENDPARLRTRTVQPERGKGRKNRPRNKQVYKNELDSYNDIA